MKFHKSLNNVLENTLEYAGFIGSEYVVYFQRCRLNFFSFHVRGSMLGKVKNES